MIWFIGFLFVILAVFAAGYRKVAAGMVAVALAFGGVLLLHYRGEEQRTVSLVTTQELAFENVTLKPYVGNYRIAGRIKNNSAKFTVRRVDLAVAVQDCIGPGTQQCVTIGESSEIVNLNIPPGEARDFEETVRLSGSNVKLKGRLEWNYSVSQIRAE